MVGARKWRLAESGEAQLPGSRSREPSPCAALVRCLVALFCELGLARWKVPSFSWMTSWRQVFPYRLLSVFQT